MINIGLAPTAHRHRRPRREGSSGAFGISRSRLEAMSNGKRHTGPVLDRIAAVGWEVDQVTGCWVWLGARTEDNYAKTSVRGKILRVTRVLLGLGPFSIDRRVAMHKCDNRPCVNPDHLVIGDHKANALDAADKQILPNGERHHWATLTDSQVVRIRQMAREGHKQQQIADYFGIHQSTVSVIVRHKIRRHQGG